MISWMEFMILILASFRLTRLLVFDEIMEFLRAPFMDEIEEENEAGLVEIYYVPKQTPIRNYFGKLLSCYWCTGVWVSAVLFIAHYFLQEIAAPLLIILAVAGMASLIESAMQSWMSE